MSNGSESTRVETSTTTTAPSISVASNGSSGDPTSNTTTEVNSNSANTITSQGGCNVNSTTTTAAANTPGFGLDFNAWRAPAADTSLIGDLANLAVGSSEYDLNNSFLSNARNGGAGLDNSTLDLSNVFGRLNLNSTRLDSFQNRGGSMYNNRAQTLQSLLQNPVWDNVNTGNLLGAGLAPQTQPFSAMGMHLGGGAPMNNLLNSDSNIFGNESLFNGGAPNNMSNFLPNVSSMGNLSGFYFGAGPLGSNLGPGSGQIPHAGSSAASSIPISNIGPNHSPTNTQASNQARTQATSMSTHTNTTQSSHTTMSIPNHGPNRLHSLLDASIFFNPMSLQSKPPSYWLGLIYADPSFRKPLSSQDVNLRQAILRDTPKFSGRSIEWGGFIGFFLYSTLICKFDNILNCLRLRNCLQKPALDDVDWMLAQPNLVPTLLDFLFMMYGRPDFVIGEVVERLKVIEKPREGDREGLIRFAMEVQKLSVLLQNSGSVTHFYSSDLLNSLYEKLPNLYKDQWATVAMYSGGQISLGDFSRWLMQKAMSISLVMGRPLSFKPSTSRMNFHVENPPPANPIVTFPEGENGQKENPKNERTKSCLICRAPDHYLSACPQFAKMDVSKRWKVVQEKGVCFRCLRTNHSARECRYRGSCGVNNCKKRHHKLLHNPYPQNERQEEQKKAEQKKEEQKKAEQNNFHWPPKTPGTLFKIIPVKIFAGNKSIEIFALLDDGSGVTLIEDKIVDQLGIVGENIALNLRWTGDVIKREENSRRVELDISGISNFSNRFKLGDVRTIGELMLPSQTVVMSELRGKYPHLNSVDISDYHDAVPTMLIGLKHSHLMVAREVKEGKVGEPIATRTRLGWVLQGGSPNSGYVLEMCECGENLGYLDKMIQGFFGAESAGVNEPVRKFQSEAELRAQKILDDSIKFDGNRFEAGLLWKKDEVHMPDNYQMALSRLKSIERKLEKDESMKKLYCEKIQQYIHQGFAEKVQFSQIDRSNGRCWFLPHFAITNPNKPGKLRVVMDAAAEYRGSSLNAQLLTGPDLYNSLLSILFKFRMGKVAVCGDIRDMFLMIGVVPKDQSFQYFLWRDCNSENEVEIYVMKRLIFGATCSPTIAQEVRNRNALLHGDKSSPAVTAILDKHYMDDYLDSFPTVAEAVDVTKKVISIHAAGGFEIRNFISNSKEVRESLPKNLVNEKIMSLDKEADLFEKVLGMGWMYLSDHLVFQLNFHKVRKEIMDGSSVPTKRETLSVLMSVFDPLGLIANYTVHGKIIVQRIFNEKCDWDETISSKLYDLWCVWIKNIQRVRNLRIPRCYFESNDQVTIELHMFVDSSEWAYAAVGYFRLIDKDGKIQVVLVSAKTKVAPKKLLSIPRLELMAAVLGTRLATSIIEGHTFPVIRRVFWSDSGTVCQWINSEPRNYKPFVAHRISEILETTAPKEWRWVPTHDNVADEATKWAPAGNMGAASRWFKGPEFLYESEENWPVSAREKRECREEMRVVYSHQVVENEPLIDMSRFSNWWVLLRCVALVKRVAARGKLPRNQWPAGAYEPKELVEAGNILIRQAQGEIYGKDVAQLKNKGEIAETSALYKLSPFLDDGIMRIRSRIVDAPFITDEMKYPVILPRDHHLTALIIMACHRRFAHSFPSTIVNELRQHFYIPSIRVVVKKVCKSCQFCKIQSATPRFPLMSPLPYQRLTTGKPFWYSGVDLFGPMNVTIGRRVELRYGVLFTCLVTRAIHLEVAVDLSADSFILCLRNFMNRRGQVRELLSDNATNFRGAKAQLGKALREFQASDSVRDEISLKGLTWKFITPGSPHHGGAWERLVRTVKTVLGVLLKNRALKPHTLQSFLIEAENIINSRPLTDILVEDGSSESLTPNHFLMGTSNGAPPPGVFTNADELSPKQWRYSQLLAEYFWRRWLREYLPDLTRRSKWFKSTKPLEKGTLVCIVDPDSPRNTWRRGIVHDVDKAKDGQVRSASVRLANGKIMHRPATRLAILDVNKES